MKPHSPKDGTSAWKGVTSKPTLSSVVTTVQNDLRAYRGEVDWITAMPRAERRRFSTW